MDSQDKIKQLIEYREEARLGGGEKRIEKQHSQGNGRWCCYWTWYC